MRTRRKIFAARASDPLLASRFLAIYQEMYDYRVEERRDRADAQQARRADRRQAMKSR